MQRLFRWLTPGLAAGLISVCILSEILPASAQVLPGPTSVNVQGRLTKPDGSALPDGPHAITVSLWDAVSGGTQVFSQTLAGVPVASGLFSAQLTALTPGVLNGSLWVQVQVDADAAMAPRVPLSSVATALKANSVPDGAIGSAQLASDPVSLLRVSGGAINSVGGNVGIGTATPAASLDVNGGVAIRGANALELGAGVAGKQVDAGKIGYQLVTPGALDIIGAGTAPANRAIKFWNEGGATFTGGIIAPALQLATGAGANKVLTSDAIGVGTWSDLPTSGWGLTGNAGTTAASFLGTTDDFATAGAKPLVIKVNNQRAMQYQYVGTGIYQGINVLGGSPLNAIGGNVAGATLSGGGGSLNDLVFSNRVDGPFGTVGGGIQNNAASYAATVGGGNDNIASASHSAVAGGGGNRAGGTFAVVAGGAQNSASDHFAAVGGGQLNTAGSDHTAVGGGNRNNASGIISTVAGGHFNTASGSYSTVGGGQAGKASGAFSTVPGGNYNYATAYYSFAAGQQAHADHDGSFVWNDSTDAVFASSGVNQFLIHATGGVGINTNNPAGYALNVAGTASVTSLTQTSDARYKTHIATLPDALGIILNLRGVAFDWDREQWKDRGFAAGRQIGFVAQEVEKVLPGLVDTDSNGYKSVAYTNVVPVLVEAVKTLKQENATVRVENAELKARLDALELTVQRLTAQP